MQGQRFIVHIFRAGEWDKVFDLLHYDIRPSFLPDESETIQAKPTFIFTIAKKGILHCCIAI